MNSTQVAGGVFGCRARKHLVFAHRPLFDAAVGLSDLPIWIELLVGAGPEMARDQMRGVALER
jgi:hypothetical protein